MICKYLFTFSRLPFTLLMLSFAVQKKFQFLQFYLFFLLLPLPLELYPKNTAKNIIKELTAYVFFPRILWFQVLCEVKVTQFCPTLCDPMDYIIHGILQAKILEWVAFPFSRAPSQPRDQTQVSCIAGDSLPGEPQEKPKNTGVGILSLLQWIFPTQGSNQGLLHCRWILYQLSYQGIPQVLYPSFNLF